MITYEEFKRERNEMNDNVKKAVEAIGLIERLSEKVINAIDFDKLKQCDEQIERLVVHVNKIEFYDEDLLFIEEIENLSKKPIRTFILEDVINHWNKRIEDKFGKSRYDLFRNEYEPPFLKGTVASNNRDGSTSYIRTNPYEKTYIMYTVRPAYFLYNLEEQRFDEYKYLDDITGSGVYTHETMFGGIYL